MRRCPISKTLIKVEKGDKPGKRGKKGGKWTAYNP